MDKTAIARAEKSQLEKLIQAKKVQLSLPEIALHEENMAEDFQLRLGRLQDSALDPILLRYQLLLSSAWY